MEFSPAWNSDSQSALPLLNFSQVHWHRPKTWLAWLAQLVLWTRLLLLLSACLSLINSKQSAHSAFIVKLRPEAPLLWFYFCFQIVSDLLIPLTFHVTFRAESSLFKTPCQNSYGDCSKPAYQFRDNRHLYCIGYQLMNSLILFLSVLWFLPYT